MKIIISLIFILSISPAYAEIYKCIENGKTSYQQTQCKNKGSEFIPSPDIGIEQQEAAVKKLDADLQAIAEKKNLQKEQGDKDRLIRAGEDNARANRLQAVESVRQTDALENSNNRIVSPSYPYRPILNPLPSQQKLRSIVPQRPSRPIVQQRPSRPITP